MPRQHCHAADATLECMLLFDADIFAIDALLPR